MGRVHTGKQKATPTIDYLPTPTGTAFHWDTSFVRAILGPVGSGKTVSCVMELFLKACAQEPNENGVRRSRHLIIRDTYPDLKTTTIQTFMEWFGFLGTLTYDSPIRFLAQFPLGDGTDVEWTVWFKSVDGSPESLDSLRSLEIGGAFINEAHKVNLEMLSVLKTRVQRFKPGRNTPLTWSGIIMDSNYGHQDCGLHRLLRLNPNDHAFYEQPPAVFWDSANLCWIVNERAENLAFLRGGTMYYARAMNGMSEGQIKQLMACQWAAPEIGKAVYPEFSPRSHTRNGRIQPMRNRDVIIGMDFGLHAAACIGQIDNMGRVGLLSEVWDDDISLEAFLDNHLIPHLKQRYPRMNYIVVGDPAGRGRSAHDKRTSFSILKSRNFNARPAPTNSFNVRRDAVAYFLNRSEGMTVSSECERTVAGFEGAYGYKERLSGGFKPEPEKNAYSHVHDAIQYLCLYAKYGFDAEQATKREKQLRQSAPPPAFHYV